MSAQNPVYSPVGDSALLVRFGEQMDAAANRRVHALAQRLRQHPLAGVGEAVPGYITLLIHYDPLLLTYDQILAWVRKQAAQAQDEAGAAPRCVEIPVIYGGEFGPDLAFVSAHTGLSADEVIRRHTAPTYTVYFIGFTPGFPYLGGMDVRLTTPRLETPRARVPAGSVGIAGPQTGVYPLESPGGWRIIGRTQLPLFDLAAQPPSLLSPGDEVRFVRA